MGKRPLLLLAAVAIAAASVVLAITLSGGGGERPLKPLIDGKIGISAALRLGQLGSVSGPLMIRNTSDQQLVLDRVEGVGLENGGPDIIGAYVLSRPNSIGTANGYRVPADGHALPGATVAPHAEVELVFGVKATKPGRHSFAALDILYHDSSGSYRSQAALVSICARITVKNCRDPLYATG